MNVLKMLNNCFSKITGLHSFNMWQMWHFIQMWHVCVCVCVCVYTHTHTHTHTYMYILYIYIYFETSHSVCINYVNIYLHNLYMHCKKFQSCK